MLKITETTGNNAQFVIKKDVMDTVLEGKTISTVPLKGAEYAAIDLKKQNTLSVQKTKK